MNIRQKRQIKLILTIVVIGIIAGILIHRAHQQVHPSSEIKVAKPKAEKIVTDEISEDGEEEDVPKPLPVKTQKKASINKPKVTPKPVTVKKIPTTTKVPVKVKYVSKIPAALIIGAHRCNLQFLSDLLKFHPKIDVRWGPDFFNSADNFEKGLDWYLDHLPKTREDELLIERNAEYYSAAKVAKRVYDTESTMKLIFMACDPTKRAVNHYRSRKAQDENLGSIEAIAIDPVKKNIRSEHDFINNSMYSSHIRNWLKYFPKEQLLVLDDQSLNLDMNKELANLEHFLEIEPAMSKAEYYFNETRGTHCARQDSKVYCFGQDKRFRKPTAESPEPINQETIEKLRDFFYQHNEDFYKTVGRKFNWNSK